MKVVNRIQLIDYLSRLRYKTISELIMYGIFDKIGVETQDDSIKEEGADNVRECVIN